MKIRPITLGNFWQRAQKYLSGMGKPGLFQVELTGRCNIDCTMCARSVGLTRPTIHMNIDLFKEIVDQSTYYKMPIGWFHHFGETLMYPHLREALAYFREHGLGTGAVSTNAILLSEEKRDILLDNANYVLCCLDTLDATAYEKIRNNQFFVKVRDNIAKLIEERDKRKSNCEIGIQFLRTSFNRDEEIHRMMDFFGQHEKLQYIEKGTVKHPRGQNISIYSSSNITDHRTGCSLMHSQLCILCSGECVPCCWDADGEQLIGDVKSQTLREIWDGKVHRRMQKEVDAGDFTNLPVCTKCAGPGSGDQDRIVEQVNLYVEHWKPTQAPVVLAPDGQDMRWLIEHSRLVELNPYLLREPAFRATHQPNGIRVIDNTDMPSLNPRRVLIYSQHAGTETYFRLKYLRDLGTEVVVVGSCLR